jgi:hypothetical protein
VFSPFCRRSDAMINPASFRVMPFANVDECYRDFVTVNPVFKHHSAINFAECRAAGISTVAKIHSSLGVYVTLWIC